MKKIIIFLLNIILIFSMTFSVYADDIDKELDYNLIDEDIINVVAEITDEKGPEILSRAGIVFERNSKKVLWGKNEHKPVPMASTTKIMTAIILLEALEKQDGKELSSTIEVCKQAANIGGSRLGLNIGDKINLNDLMYGLMLRSGNDAAIQIAVSISGSVEEFAKLMNEKALELKLENTHFITPHGLDDEEHYTTAYELAIITDYALNIEKFAEVVKTKTYEININGYNKVIGNTNELLGYLEGVNGVKTGFTNNAGRCLVTSVDRNGFEIITVVLGADTKKIRTRDSIRLIEYIYSNYELINIREIIETEFKNRVNMKKVKVNKGNEEYAKLILDEHKYELYPVKKGVPHSISVEIELPSALDGPAYKGQVIGELIIKMSNERIGKVDVLIEKDILKKTVKEFLFVIFENYKCYFNSWP